MAGHTENVAERTRHASNAGVVSMAISHVRQDSATTLFGQDQRENVRWVVEAAEAMRRSTVAIYAYSKKPRKTSIQHSRKSGNREDNTPVQAWQGSGFCVKLETVTENDASGKPVEKLYAIYQTNHHVVSGRDEDFDYGVELYDGPGKIGEDREATVMYRDEVRDVAYIRVDVTGIARIQAAKLARPDAIRVGEPVIATGNPKGTENTVVPGIISSEPTMVDQNDENGSINGDPDLKGMLKHSAPTLPGNSGGPVSNMENEVVGMHTAAIVDFGGRQGHAIPVTEFAVMANHVHLFTNVQRRIQPIERNAIGDKSKQWHVHFDEGLAAYTEEFERLYGKRDPEGKKAIHQMVLNDPGMIHMLLSPIAGAIVRGYPEDVILVKGCVAKLEATFGVKLRINIESDEPGHTHGDSVVSGARKLQKDAKTNAREIGTRRQVLIDANPKQ